MTENFIRDKNTEGVTVSDCLKKGFLTMPLKKQGALTQLELPFGSIKGSRPVEREAIVDNVLYLSTKLKEKNKKQINDERRKSIHSLRLQAEKLNW